MKRLSMILIALFLVVFLVGGSLAGNADCCNYAACSDIDWTACSHSSVVSTVVSYTANSAKWCACSSAQALCACHRVVHSGVNCARDAVSATANWTGDALNKVTSEVTSLSLRALRSVFSSFSALVSDLMHS